jgi:ligand-binding sensor domain-containing protein/signal transduction histidine kinase/DNA-binding response OmpR family regulator
MKLLLKIAALLPLLVLSFWMNGQQPALHKSFLTVEEGLSHNEVTSIVQDHDGFIWIGTRGGLNRYDGYEFKIFNQVPGDSNSLVNPSVEGLFVDSKGNLWIGTKSGGVSKYNPFTEKFQNITVNYKNSSEVLPDNRILSFYEDKKGRIWMGTWSNGLVIYDEKKHTSQQYLGNRMVNSIVETSDDHIWIGTNEGLFQFILEENSIIEQTNPPFNFPCYELRFDKKRNALWIASANLKKLNLTSNEVKQYEIGNANEESSVHSYETIDLDIEGNIWLGTWGTGFYHFNPDNEIFERYLLYPENRATLNKDYDAVLSIFQDKDGNLWLGTNGGGICVLTPKLNFNHIGYHPEPIKGLQNTRIMTVVDDSKGNLWLGTIGSGLYWSPDRENFYPVEYQANVNRSRFFIIKYLYEDKTGNIWVGTNTGPYLIQFKQGKPEMIRPDISSSYPDINNLQNVSLLDAKNMLWFGSLMNGLFLLDKTNGLKVIKHLRKNSAASGDLNSSRISYLFEDSKERIWIGTYDGLHIYNSKDTTVHPAEKSFEISGEFTGNIITCMDEDPDGNIWIGTPNGLNKLRETGENSFQVVFYTEEDGLSSNFIKAISHDLNGNIWISTNTGISKLTTTEAESLFVNYNETDGIQGNNYTEASVFRNNRGEIFFGSSLGLTYFNPEEIPDIKIEKTPVLTGIKIFNQPVNIGQKFGSKIILEQSISRAKKLVIPYRYNNFEIEFSAMDYKAMGRNKYAYLLENHDKEWINIGTRRFINFNNLRQGDYILKIKSADSHNFWNETPVEIAVTILPPFWQTWYALVFYVFLITAIVLLIRWNAIKQMRLANNLEKEKLLHEQDQRISELKFQFFTNISHEFRTPLSLMIAPLKEVLNPSRNFKLSDELSLKIEMVYQNADRLMKLVNQLLDFRKAETGNMKLAARYSDMEAFVNEVCIPFNELAKINNISFKVKSLLKTKYIWFDREKLEIIINNLLSNAFKKVKENGKIEIALYEEEEEILLSVSDNGPGIKPAEIQHIFDRFYRVEKTDNYGSSGIGLALTKRLVELHKGTISVSSQPNQHTEFIVALPKGNSHLSEEEMVTSMEPVQKNIQNKTFFPRVFSTKQKGNLQSGKTILVVDDNREITDYMESLLSPYYSVEVAFNGTEGYKKALELKPDLIISDVMMPETDGYEFCKKVKTSIELSTVPFILLTAKNEEHHKILGTRTGADDFISKPFDPEYLLQKIENLLLSKEKMKKQFSKSVRLEPSEVEITPADQVFIEKVIDFVEKNLQNPNFSSEVLAQEMNMSNSTLYRKLKELTDSSTAEFIRSIRIKRAGQLLAYKEKTVTEIAYEVGFNDVKHFRTVFQKQFGCAPTEYREKL